MKKFSLLAVSLLLAGCAPSQTGGGSGAPQVMSSPVSPVAIKPGQTLFVQYTYPRGAVEVDDQYFDGLTIDFNNRDIDRVRSVSAPAAWLTMTAQGLPKGLDVSLARAFILKEITRTNNTSTGTQVNFFERVQVTLKVTAAPTAEGGSKTGTLVYSDGKTKSDVPLLVRVDAPESRTASLP